MSTTTVLPRTSLPRPLAMLLALVLAIGLVAVAAPPAEASRNTSVESHLVSMLNSSRAANGLPALSVRGDLTDVAYRWSTQMASSGNLAHNPNYSSQICCWQRVGENVGYTSNMSSDNAQSIAKRLHDAFMASSGHRANILSPHFTEVGIGVHMTSDRAWATQNFRQPTGSSSGSSSSGSSGSSSSGSSGTTSSQPQPASTPQAQATPAPSTPAPANTPAPAPKSEPKPEPEPEPEISPEELKKIRAARDEALYVDSPTELGLWVPDFDGYYVPTQAVLLHVMRSNGLAEAVPVSAEDAGGVGQVPADSPSTSAARVLSAQHVAGGGAGILLLISLLLLRVGTGRSGRGAL